MAKVSREGKGSAQAKSDEKSKKRGRLEATADRRENSVVVGLLRAVDATFITNKRILVVNDTSETIVQKWATFSSDIHQWKLRSSKQQQAAPWAPEGPFDLVTLRIPASKPLQELCFHALGSVLAPGGQILVYGANDEGIRSLGKRLKGLFSEVKTLSTRNHGRVWQGRRLEAASSYRSPLSQWRLEHTLEVPEGYSGTYAYYPGAFNKGRLDKGSALLLKALPSSLAPKKLLDFGCGIGILARGARLRWPDVGVMALDSDPWAIQACEFNVEGCHASLSDGWSVYKGGKVDLILSNPPFHQGKSEDFGTLFSLIEEAPKYLNSGGSLIIVCLSQISIAEPLKKRFASVKALQNDRLFTVWQAHN